MNRRVLMLGFLNRHQKIFISIFAVLVGSSFIFFGLSPKSHSLLDKDPVAFTTSTQKKIKRSQIEGLKALLDTSLGENLLFGKALGANFFTDPFINAEFIQPGFLKILSSHALPLIKQELMQKWEKEKNFVPYEHPGASFINAQVLWSLHAPQLLEKLDALKEAKTLENAFEIKQQLYLLQCGFDSFNLWQALSDQESQFNWLSKDPNLNPERLNLFGYQKPSDWFGSQFMDLIVRSIYEVNHQAKSKGYIVSSNEAEQELVLLNEINFKRLRAIGVEEFESSADYFAKKLQYLGVSKTQLIDLYKELLLFKRYMGENSDSILVSQSTLESFEHYADEKVHLVTYSPKSAFHFKKWDEVLQFESYLMALGKKRNQLSLNFALKPIEEIATQTPQLIEQKVKLEYKSIALSELAMQVKVKDIWSYKTNCSNVDTLLKKFPTLLIKKCMTEQELQASFEALSSNEQAAIDHFIRNEIVQSKPQWIEKALESQQIKEACAFVRRNGQGTPFIGLETFENKKEFLSSLFSADLKGFLEAPFSFDQENFYQIARIHQVEDPKLVDYSELKMDGSLDKLLYLTLKEEAKAKGEVISNSSKQMKLTAEEVFADLKKAIRNDYLTHYSDAKVDFDDSFYCQYRLYSPLRESLAYLKDHAKNDKNALFTPFCDLERQERTLVRYLSDSKQLDTFLSYREGQFSDVHFYESSLQFSKLISHPKTSSQHLLQAHLKKALAKELKQYLFESIVEDLPLDKNKVKKAK